jgi:hypothetical protein
MYGGQGLGFGVYDLGFRVRFGVRFWGVGVQGLGFRV